MARDDTLSKLRSGRLGRLAMLGKMGAGLAGTAAGAAGRWAVSSKDKAAETLHKKAAERLLQTLGEMKGLPMKLGQIYSYLDGVVPPEYESLYAETLGKLRTKMKPLDWAVMGPILTAELGAPPDEVFEDFNPEPIAAASIGQVYRARLPDIGDVAIKVQFPGIADAIHADLQNAEALMSAMSLIVPRMDVEQSLKDVTERIEEECDYLAERGNQERFAALWANDPEIVIPATVPHLCTERVLVTTFIDGRGWDEVVTPELSTEERERIGRILFRFVFESLYKHGVFNADPHPGNILFLDDGRIAFLDFGCVQAYTPEVLDSIRRIRDLIVEKADRAELREALIEGMGLDDVYDDAMWAIFEDYMRFCFEPVAADQPFLFTRDYTAQITRLTMDFKMAMAKRIFKAGIQAPKAEGFVFLTRIIFGLSSLLSRLGAQSDWRALSEACDSPT